MTSRAFRAASVVAAAAALSVVAGCTSGGDPAASPAVPSTPSDTRTATSPTPGSPTPGSPAPTPSPTEITAKPGRSLLAVPAEVTASSDGRLAVTRVGDVTVVADAERATASGYDRRGVRRWSISAPRTTSEGDPTVSVAGAQTVVSWDVDYDAFPGRRTVIGLDTATGRRLWSDRTGSYVGVVGRTAYVSHCLPRQTGRLGECTLVARDVATGGVRWQVPTYSATQVTEPGPDLLRAPPERGTVLVDGYPRGAGTTNLLVLDSATGRALGPARPQAGYVRTAFGVVLPGPDDRDPDDGCRSVVTGYTPDGNRVWRRAVVLDRDERDRERCDFSTLDAVPTATGSEPRYLAVRTTRGRPAVLDARTGRTVWTGPSAGTAHAVVDGRVLVRTGRFDTGPGLAAYGLRSGRQVWSHLYAEVGSLAVVGGRALFGTEYCDSGGTGAVLDIATGRTAAGVPGCLLGAGPGWYAHGAEGGQVTVSRLG